MADEQTYTATLELRHVPDEYTPQEKADGATWELGAGHYTLYAIVDGAALPITSFKGGGVRKKLAAAKESQQSQQSSETGASPPVEPTPTPQG